MNLCMAATYDPDPRAPNGFRLPFNLETGEVDPGALERLAAARSDQSGARATARTCARCAASTSIAARRDQYHIHYGIAHPVQAAARRGHRPSLQEFDDNHSDIDYRMDVSLPFLTRALR